MGEREQNISIRLIKVLGVQINSVRFQKMSLTVVNIFNKDRFPWFPTD